MSIANCPPCDTKHDINDLMYTKCICGVEEHLTNLGWIWSVSYNNKDLMKREVDEKRQEFAKAFDKQVANDQFIKADNGKARVSLVEPGFILGVSNVLTFGANKYEPGNWKKLPEEELYRYKDSLMRHILAWLGGEQIDPESGLPHLDHIGCNVMFLRYFEEKAFDGLSKCP